MSAADKAFTGSIPEIYALSRSFLNPMDPILQRAFSRDDTSASLTSGREPAFNACPRPASGCKCPS